MAKTCWNQITKKYISKNQDNATKYFEENVLVINYDEKKILNTKINTEINTEINKKMQEINDKKPRILIVCTQNSKSGPYKHFQHLLGEKIKENYKLLSKVDASIPILSFLCNSNVRTRIYYDSDKIIIGFQDNRLSKKSSFSMFSSNNLYNSDVTEINNKEKDIIVSYKMRRKNINKCNGVILCIITVKTQTSFRINLV